MENFVDYTENLYFDAFIREFSTDYAGM